MLLWKYKEIIAHVTRANFYENHHLLVSNFFDISLLKKHLVKDIVFAQRLRRTVETKTSFGYIFGENITCILSRVALENDLNYVRRNWQNVNIQASSIRNNDIDDTVEKRVCNTKLNTEN